MKETATITKNSPKVMKTVYPWETLDINGSFCAGSYSESRLEQFEQEAMRYVVMLRRIFTISVDNDQIRVCREK